MKKILLINPNTYKIPHTVFPLGLAYIDEALQQADFETLTFDFNLDKLDVLAQTIDDFCPECIGISLRNVDDIRIGAREFFVNDIRDLIKAIRLHCSIPVVLGGSGFSVLPLEIYELCQPDFGITGEGEVAFVSLLNGKKQESIPGLVYRTEKGIEMNPVRLLDWSDAGIPVRSQRLLDYYLQDGGMANVQTQRGCPLKCCYCTYPVIEGRQYRHRTGDSIAREFLNLKEMGARYVFIVDSVFNTSETHVRGICEALIDAGTPLPWGCFIRPYRLSRELVHLMKEAGLTHIEFGSDSLNTDILKNYKKGFTFDDIRRNSEIVRDVGIDYCHFLIFGGPGETEESMDITFENSKRISGALYFPSIGMRVYPQTHLFEVNKQVSGASKESLLQPTYFIAPGLNEKGIAKKILEYSQQSSNWVNLQQSPEFDAIAQRLRKKGVAGPLWNFLSVMRRLS